MCAIEEGERAHRTCLNHPLLKEKVGGGRDDMVHTASRVTDCHPGQLHWSPDQPQDERAEERGGDPAVGTHERAARLTLEVRGRVCVRVRLCRATRRKP